MQELDVMRKIAEAVIEQAKTVVGDKAREDGCLDWNGKRKITDDQAWGSFTERQEDAVDLVISRMVSNAKQETT